MLNTAQKGTLLQHSVEGRITGIPGTVFRGVGWIVEDAITQIGV